MEGILGVIAQMTQNNPTLNLLMLMVIIWTTGVLCRAIHQPPILGELTAGIIFGPAFLGLIYPNEMLNILSDLGVFFLMFYAGLETNPLDLNKYRRQSFAVGISGFLIPFIVAYLACMIFGMTREHSLFIALGLSITAIAVSARVLHDLELSEQRITPIILGASVVDDVLALAFFTAIIDIGINGGHGVNWHHYAITMVKVVAFFTFSICFGMWVYPKFGRFLSARSSKGFTFALIMALLFGFLAELAELHIIIGAYIAGLFVSEGVVSHDLMVK
ncbi:MAG: hypothetical protein C0623_07245, partial [Desulfuromonas sp.]